MDSKINKNSKAKYWTIVVYPESLPNDWEEIISRTGIEWACSPLHQHDINADGEPKKPHYHCILCYPNTTTFNHVNELCSDLNTVIPQKLSNVRGMYRYFVHLDNPEKYQYQLSDIRCFNGFDSDEYAGLSQTDIVKMKLAITHYIKDNNIISYLDLILQCEEINFDWCRILMSNSTYFTSVIKDNWLALKKNI